MNKITKDLYIVEDWTDFDNSFLDRISFENFLEKGLDVFSKKDSTHIVPHLTITSYPHAKNIAKIVKENLKGLSPNHKLRILEAGAGTGIFSRNFLIAAQELGFLEQIEYIITDISELSLRQIKDRGTLADFIENEHYKLVVLNLLDLDAAQDLHSEAFQLQNLDLVICNYVIDQLPMLPIKKVSDNSFEKLQIRILSSDVRNANITNIKELKDMSSFVFEKRWIPWDLDSLSEIQSQHLNTLNELFRKEPPGSEIRYCYGALAVFANLNSKLTDNGIIYISDIASGLAESSKKDDHFSFYGKTKANMIQESLMILYFKMLGYSFLEKRESTLARLLFFKDKHKSSEKVLKDLFLSINDLETFKQITNLFPKITDSSLVQVAKALLDRLLEIDNVSATSLTFQGSYHFLLKDYQKALEFYKKALEIDFSSQWQLEFKINGTEAFI